LIVTHSYAPDPTPRAFRWAAIAAHWAAQGHTVHVLTTGRRGGPPLAVENGVTVHRIGERAFGALSRGAAREPSGGPAPRRTSLKRLYDATWKRLYWPDYAAIWHSAARNTAGKLVAAEYLGAVVTVSHPFTGQLVGLALRRAFPKLRWLADMGDPFSLPGSVAVNNATLYGGLNRRFERRVLARCDVATVTIEGCRAALAAAFPHEARKLVVVPPLLSLPDAPSSTPAVLGEAGTIHLVYLGMLYPGIREPGPLLALFAAMRRASPALRLHFFGETQALIERPGEGVTLHGPVARERVGPIMAAADVLVNIANGTGFQLPSKLVEYVHAGRPILNVAPRPGDTAAEFLAAYPAALSLVCAGDSLDPDTVTKALAFVARARPVPQPAREEFLARHRIAPIAAAYERLLAPDAAPC
jgi:hypothetical protein